MSGLSNLRSNLPKTQWIILAVIQNSHLMEANSRAYRKGGICSCGWRKFFTKLGHGGCERGGYERKKESRGEREVSGFWWGATGRRRKEKGLAKLQKCPSSTIFLVPNYSILDTASLIHNTNFKPKIDNVTIHRLLFPKNIEVRFSKYRTISRVHNLIIFGFLLDLVLINNLY